tara:strand:+ start:39 stop:614 length:576 start_codon:yes stop_codon:yes gene_type:complete
MARIPVEEAASRHEVEAAIKGLTEADHLRILKYANLKAQGLDCSNQELINEAFALALNPAGEKHFRRWRKGQLPFLHLILGAIRSTASNWRKKKKSDPHFVEPNAVEDEPASMAKSRELELSQHLVRKEMLQKIKDEFRNDQLVLDIIDGFAERMARAEIIEVLEIDENTYDAAARRLRRKANSLYPKGEN